MKRNVLIYGLIIGAILSANMVVIVNQIYSNPGFKGNDIIGYTAMVVMFSLIFFGVRNYRNKHLNGTISFGKAFKTGFLIAFIGSSIYVLVWLFYYYLFVPDFMDVYTDHALKTCSASDLPAMTTEMANFKEMYKNPLFVILITYSEVLPVGLIVTLISSFILKRKSSSTGNQIAS